MGTVLVVEDDPLLRRTVRDLLEGVGHQVFVARNGVEAHALAELHSPEVVVTDLLMPVSGGVEFISRLRSQGASDLPVILLSGAANLEEVAERLGAAAWLEKPCRADLLIATVEAVLPEFTPPG